MLRIALFLSVLAVVAAVPAIAEICALDHVPAATLLLPYFEVDIDDPTGERSESTEVVINNNLPAPTVARFTFWTDLGVPVGSADLLLTGFDYVEFKLGDFFRVGGGRHRPQVWKRRLTERCRPRRSVHR